MNTILSLYNWWERENLKITTGSLTTILIKLSPDKDCLFNIRPITIRSVQRKSVYVSHIPAWSNRKCVVSRKVYLWHFSTGGDSCQRQNVQIFILSIGLCVWPCIAYRRVWYILIMFPKIPISSKPLLDIRRFMRIKWMKCDDLTLNLY